MSLYLNVEPKYHYMGFAIVLDVTRTARGKFTEHKWTGYMDDGNTYRVVDLEAHTLKRLKEKIRRYHIRKHNGYGERIAKRRLEYLRTELREERISYEELAELQGWVSYIDENDVELLEAAGVPEK